MTQPSVCAVMLTADRPRFAQQAVASFRAQTYNPCSLLIYDTGDSSWHDSIDLPDNEIHCRYRQWDSIGMLRNAANRYVMADVIVHWDDDDLSHPNRIAEQVALLQSSGADLVGYNEALFWREGCDDNAGDPRKWSSAWLYSNTDPHYAIGASLCYWRRTWERNPFDESHKNPPSGVGEDAEFVRQLVSAGADSVVGVSSRRFPDDPRLICRIHRGNSSNYSQIGSSPLWRRVLEWDIHCRETVASVKIGNEVSA